MVNVNVNVNVNPSSSSQSLVNCAAAQPASPAGAAGAAAGGGGGGGANSSNNNNANTANAAIVGPGAGAGAGSGSGSFAASASASASSPPPLPSSSVNTLALASTILKSCPMYDTIAILIFLLQLPPIVLTLVQFLFASLTFMPPAGISTSALTSNFDIFQGPAGTPSLSTMIAMDAFCLLVWGLFMWTWAQNFAIDLAQVQVAITLGGGSSEKNGGVNLLCVLVVLALHLLRSQGVQDFVLTRLLSAKVVSAEMLAKIAAVIPADLRSQVAADREPPQPPTWLRSLLAVHILAQAGTAMARRSMAKNRSPVPSKGKRGGGGGGSAGGGGNSSSNSKDAGGSAGNLDTEAAAGSGSHLDSSAFESSSASGIHSSYFTSSQDIVPTTSSTSHNNNATNTPPAIKETRERLSSAKKRRRQANQVRSRQPFWAALASTKVTVMREYEHSRTGAWSSSAFGSVSSASASSSADTGAAGGAAPGYSSSFVSSVPSALSLSSGSGSGSGYIHPMAEDDFEGGLVQDIWITSIESSAIKFAASDFPIVTSDCCGGINGDAVIPPTASSSSPFSGTGTGTGAGTDRKDDDDAGLEQQQQQQQQQQQLQQLQTDNINPFHVYVNGAPWATVSMVPVPQNAEEPSLVRWRGEISGLAPDCTYSCSFVRRDTGARICVMSVKTSRKSENEAFAPSTNNSPRPSLRPSSPLTTMKNSVRSTEEQLAQRRQYLRKVKGDQKATISRLRKEVENYTNRLKSANDETKLRQRTTQLERTIKQTEDQIHTLSQRVKDSENVPELERAEWKRARARFESEMERLADLRAELDAFRKSSNEKVSSVQSELTNTVQKRERLQARIVRLTEQLERITVANEKGMNERERRAAEQFARETERANIEANFLEQITLLANSVHDYQGRTANLWAQANAIDQAFQAQQQQYYLLHNGVNPAAAASAAAVSAASAAAVAANANANANVNGGSGALTEPLTPDGHLPGTNPDLAATIPTTSTTTATTTTAAAAAAAHTALSAFSPFAQSALGSMSLSPAISSSALDQFQQQHPLHQHQHQHHQHPQHSFHHATSAHPHHHQPHASLTPSFNSLSSSAAVQAAFSPANATATATAGEAHNAPSGGGGGSGSNNGSSSTGSGGSGSNSNSASASNSNSNSKRHRSLSNFSGRSIQLDRNGTPYMADAMSRPVIHETAATASTALQRESGSPGESFGSGSGTGSGSHRKWSVKE